MKKFLTVFSVLVALVVVFSSCSKNDDPQPVVKFALVKADPADGTNTITRTQKFTLEFSKPIVVDPAKLAKTVLYQSSVSTTNFSWTLTGSDKVLTIQFTSTGYTKGAEFFITLDGFKSVDGDVLPLTNLHYFYTK